MCSSETMNKIVAISHVMKLLEDKWDRCMLIYFCSSLLFSLYDFTCFLFSLHDDHVKN